MTTIVLVFFFFSGFILFLQGHVVAFIFLDWIDFEVSQQKVQTGLFALLWIIGLILFKKPKSFENPENCIFEKLNWYTVKEV